MNYQYQTGNRDCFPTCFRNAMLHYGISIIPELDERLDVFLNGTECISLYGASMGIEEYDRSLLKFKEEWQGTEYYFKSKGRYEPIKYAYWAEYLLNLGVRLEFNVGPIENRNLVIEALQSDKITICDIMVPSDTDKKIISKHAVLIVKYLSDKLLIHDPLEFNKDFKFESDQIMHLEHELGTNLSIDCNYFFSTIENPFKPIANKENSELGYSFLIIGKE